MVAVLPRIKRNRAKAVRLGAAGFLWSGLAVIAGSVVLLAQPGLAQVGANSI